MKGVRPLAKILRSAIINPMSRILSLAQGILSVFENLVEPDRHDAACIALRVDNRGTTESSEINRRRERVLEPVRERSFGHLALQDR